jgi:Tn7-like transposition protein D/TniQ
VFPLVQPYPDELLYSVLARQRMRQALTANRPMLRLAFGDGSRVASALLQSGLDALQWVGGGSVTPAELLERLTLFPYYAVLHSAARRRAVAAQLLRGRAESVFFSLGLPATSIKRAGQLRLCPDCSRDDQARWGETYWRRAHQLPGVYVCTHHAVPLVETRVPAVPVNRHEYVAARTEMLESGTLLRFGADVRQETLHTLAKCSVAILAGELDDLRPRLRKALRAQMLQGDEPSDRSGWSALGDAMLASYGEEYLERCGALRGMSGPHGWLAASLRNFDRLRHPLRHLLLYILLDARSAQASRSEERWRCPNRLAPHYRHWTVRRTPGANRGLAPGVARYECSCGLLFTSEGERGDGFLVVRRVIRWGRQYVERACRDHQRGLAIRAIARELDVDSKTVHRLLRHAAGTGNGVAASVALDEARAAWQASIHACHGSVRAARRAVPALYARLYRNDRTWLLACNRDWWRPHGARLRVDWQARDQDIASRVRCAATRIREERPFRRVTRNACARATGLAGRLDKWLSKLPVTVAALADVCESVEAFQARRLRALSAPMRRASGAPVRWQLLRSAGLPERRVTQHLEAVLTALGCGRKEDAIAGVV